MDFTKFQYVKPANADIMILCGVRMKGEKVFLNALKCEKSFNVDKIEEEKKMNSLLDYQEAEHGLH